MKWHRPWRPWRALRTAIWGEVLIAPQRSENIFRSENFFSSPKRWEKILKMLFVLKMLEQSPGTKLPKLPPDAKLWIPCTALPKHFFALAMAASSTLLERYASLPWQVPAADASKTFAIWSLFPCRFIWSDKFPWASSKTQIGHFGHYKLLPLPEYAAVFQEFEQDSRHVCWIFMKGPVAL